MLYRKRVGAVLCMTTAVLTQVVGLLCNLAA